MSTVSALKPARNGRPENAAAIAHDMQPDEPLEFCHSKKFVTENQGFIFGFPLCH